MAIEPGQTLSHYRLIEKIGEGGMGVVWKALDTILDREVAIKFLPEKFAADPEPLARFKREAKLLASLNHPHIASIHELAAAGGLRFLVLEFVPGETLAERLIHGPLPVNEALGVILQISEALEAAHASGILHRDLKPANVKITPEGKVKVLDFGLAKSFTEVTTTADASQSPTITGDLTQAGTLLGTAGYLSPEQARGRDADKRSDIWAFGCCLYEALTGHRAFPGETISDAIGAILHTKPDWTLLPAHTPRSIRTLLRRCVNKDPDGRLHDIADARIEIQEAQTADEADAEVGLSASPGAGWYRLLPWALVIALAIALTVSWQLRRRPAQQALGVSARLSINLPAEAPLAPAAVMPLSVGRTSLAISPGGEHLVYVAYTEGETRLYLRETGRDEVTPIAGTAGAHSPFFSPDGEWIGYFANDKLKKVSLTGGAPVTLSDATLGFGGSWSDDDVIFFSTDYYSGISRVPASGGRPEALTELGPGDLAHFFPHALPEGRGVLFSYSGSGLGVFDSRTGETKALSNQGGTALYSSTGHIIYASRGTILAVPFDLERLEFAGPPRMLVEGVRTERWAVGQFALSSNGMIVFAPGRDCTVGSLVWIDRKGVVQPVGAPSGDYQHFRISPDGSKLALPTVGVGGTDIWLYDFSRDNTTRLTFDGRSSYPLWSPDGDIVFFSSSKTGALRLYWKRADGSGEAVSLLDQDGAGGLYSIFPDGDLLLYGHFTPDTKGDLWLLPLEGGKPSTKEPVQAYPFLKTPQHELFGALSPDGKWIAYTSDETGGWEVYVRAYPGAGSKVRISNQGGEEALWSPDGRELFYRIGSQWFVVEVSLGERFTAGRPGLLFEGPYINTPGYSYDVAADGERFLVVEVPEHTQALTKLAVITNGFEELKRKAEAAQ
jgi:serine/threonine-protein kinase